MSKAVRLLDATLRDGSYCIDFQFTAADTAVLVGMLDAAGVGFVELGNGSGSFNHKAPPHFRTKVRQAASDEDYFAAARKCAKRSKLGIITGPFGMDDLPMLAQHKFDFVRMAVMADKALEPINLKMAERAKSLGLTFSVNLMQTTAITPARAAELAIEFAKAGTDWFYIVDSSGGLLPQAVTEYVSRVRDASDITIGYHAHHNSGLAIANCLAAIEAGATMVDGTLQGLGRDVGNAPTEQLLFMLQRIGHERGIDVESVSHAGDLVRGLLLEKGNDPTYFAAGASEIHSSNVEALVQFAVQRGLGARSLLAAISQGDVKLIGAGMKSFPEEVVGPACARATPIRDATPTRELVEVLGEDIARASSRSLVVLADVLYARAAKWHKRRVLHLVPAADLPFAGPVPWDLDKICGITVGVTADDLRNIDFGDRAPEVIVSDPALGDAVPGAATSLRDAFIPVVADAAAVLAAVCLDGGARVFVACSDAAIASALHDKRLRVIGPADGDSWIADVQPSDTVIVAGHRDVPANLAALAQRGTRLLRPAIAPAIAARVATLLDLRGRLANGRGQHLVDPIFVPAAGQAVVDDPSCPTTVLAGSEAAVAAAATERARTLARGRGRL